MVRFLKDWKSSGRVENSKERRERRRESLPRKLARRSLVVRTCQSSLARSIDDFANEPVFIRHGSFHRVELGVPTAAAPKNPLGAER